MTSDERISCDTSEFASYAVREQTFDFFVSPLKSPTRRNDDLHVGIANGLDKQGHLAKVVGRLGVTRVQNTVKVKKEGRKRYRSNRHIDRFFGKKMIASAQLLQESLAAL